MMRWCWLFQFILYNSPLSGSLIERCGPATYENQFGIFKHDWIDLNTTTEPQSCGYDKNKAVFKCKKNSNELYIEPIYFCLNTAKTIELQKLAEDKVKIFIQSLNWKIEARYYSATKLSLARKGTSDFACQS